jgi:hypothetical protein
MTWSESRFNAAAVCAIILVGCGGSVANSSAPDGGGNRGSDTGTGSSPETGTTGSGDSSTGTSEAGMPSGGPDAGPGQTACGQTTCNAATQVCCVTMAGSSCTAPNACNGDTLVCSSSESCAAGDVCCATIAGVGPGGPGRDGGRGIGIQTECRGMCTFDEVELCVPGGAACPNNEMCRQVGMSDYYACERGGPPPPPDAGSADAGGD